MNQEPDPRLAETTLSSRRIYEGRVVKLRVDEVRLPDGRTSAREIIEHRGAAALVPLLPGREVILVRQWRHAVGKVLLEIPAGLLEPGEAPIDCARRELAEETGYAAGRIEPLTSIYSAPGFATERLHIFLAQDLQPTQAQTDEDEFLEPVTLAWDQALAMCKDGRIEDGKTVVGILAADAKLRG